MNEDKLGSRSIVDEVQLAKLEREATKPKQIAGKKAEPTPPTSSSSTGSGFFVSKLGHIITNEHVVRNCETITVGDNAKRQVTVTLLEIDKRNDLALLKISTTKLASVDTKSLIRKLGIQVVPLASEGLLRSEDAELGEDVLVSGYPYGDIFSNSIKVTKGIVSASRGMGDDIGQFQIDAAVQPGNSGGPIYDENGNIVGVVVAQLNKLKVAKAIGSMPENVNFGIKASTVRQFLTASGLPTKWSNRSKSMSTKDLAKIAKNQTVMVACNR
jgi:serine protease Do